MARVLRPALVDVLDEHCEELGFLRVVRRGITFSPDARLRHLGAAELRIEAHKDALAVAAGASGACAKRRAAKVERTSRDPFQWAAAIEVAIERAEGEEVPLWARLVEAEADLVDGFSEALRHAHGQALSRMLARRGPWAEAPRVLAAAADAIAFRRGFAPDEELPGTEHGPVRRARARGLSVRAGDDPGATERALRELLEDDDVTVRRAALWSLLLCDAKSAAEIARRDGSDPFSVRVLGLAGDRSDLETIAHALVPEATRRAAIEALADLGHPAAGTLLARLATEGQPFSPLAARALTKLAGDAGKREADCLSQRIEAQLSLLASLPEQPSRILRGQTFDSVGPHSSLEALWTAAVTQQAAREQPWLLRLRREVPCGFFSGEMLDHMTPADGPWSS